jgi:hypothetical protein
MGGGFARLALFFALILRSFRLKLERETMSDRSHGDEHLD